MYILILYWSFTIQFNNSFHIGTLFYLNLITNQIFHYSGEVATTGGNSSQSMGTPADNAGLADISSSVRTCRHHVLHPICLTKVFTVSIL